MAEDGMNIKLRNIIVRDAYKDRYIKEKALEKEKERKNRQEILQRSAARFSSSPFSVNFIGLEEISEYRRRHEKKSQKPKKSSKFKRKTSETRDQKFLTKLRNEVRHIENSTFHLDEKKLEAALNEKKILSTTHELRMRTHKYRSKGTDSFSSNSKEVMSNKAHSSALV